MKKLFLCIGLLGCSLPLLAQPSFISDSLDNYIRRGMSEWEVPGLAIVIVKDGKVALLKGYGVRNAATREPVDPETLFMIASNSKLFTGMALAQLEYRGKLSLDDRITRYFPWFRLYDSTSTQLVSIRDLLSHRIGTKTFQGDFTFWNGTLTREQIMEKMRLLKPSGIFRQDYGYCNSCYLAAGQVIPAVTGRSWEQYVQDSFLAPLEMKYSTSVSAGMNKRPNVASPYTTSYTGQLKQVPYDQWDNLGPAASLISNVTDLSHWLLFQLDSGRYNGRQVVPFLVLQRTRDVNIITNSRKSPVLPVHFRGYGLGLSAADYNGRQVYWHTGGAGGMLSNVCFVPEEKLGIAILTNNDNQSFFEALRYQVLDAYLGVAYTDRSRQLLPSHHQEMKGQLDRITAWKARTKGAKPSMPLKNYAGIYANELYGTITITAENDRLIIKFSGHSDLSATLTCMNKDEWLLEYNNIEYGIFATRFRIDAGQVRSLDIRVNEFVEADPYTFTKQ